MGVWYVYQLTTIEKEIIADKIREYLQRETRMTQDEIEESVETAMDSRIDDLPEEVFANV